MTELSVSTQRRILKDVRDMLKNPLTDEGITYIHDEDNMMKGYALIIGPPDSPYEHGFFLFEIEFPVDYPFHPPRVIYRTNDGKTRFHPNLYSNGKVCLSILNTWEGEQWTSTQTIRSILMTIRSLFDKNALTMEPGITLACKSVKTFDCIVQIKTVEIAMFRILDEYMPHPTMVWRSFLPIMKNYLRENREKIDAYLPEVEKNAIAVLGASEGQGYQRVYKRTIPYSCACLYSLWEMIKKDL